MSWARAPICPRWSHGFLACRNFQVLTTFHAYARLATTMTNSEISGVIGQLKVWRKANNLSQAAAVVVMRGLGFEIRQSTIEKWESGALRPGRFTVQVLAMFLEKHPEVECPTGFRTFPAPLSAGKVAQVRKLRAKGSTLKEVAEQLDISISSVSRIAKKNRRAAA
jgi:transcriptional regulator with XRE-family HTH domain